MPRRLLFHVQHLLGIGHLKRVAAVARAAAASGLEVTVLSGGESVPGFSFGGARLVQLPPVRAADGDFRRLVDAAGRPIDDAFRAERRRRVLAAFERVRPDVVLVEGFPFGRRAFAFELVPLVAAARGRVPVAASIRDVLVARNDPRRLAETVARVRADFAAILVHGDPDLVPFEASFPAAAEIADRLRYTGYVHEPAPAAADGAGRGEVIVSAGGGAVGGALLEMALDARKLTRLADRPWRLVGGANLPAESRAALAAVLPEGVVLDGFRPDLPALFRRALVSLSQAGYNTVLDLLAARCRAVLVPYEAPGETEQALRAARLASLGLATVLREAALAPATLAAALDRAAAAPEPPALAVDLDGARKSAAILAALAGAKEEA